MKNFCSAVAISAMLAGSAAMAGNPAPPIMNDTVIVEETTSSAGGIIIPLLFLVMLALTLDGDSPQTAPSDINLKTDIVPTGDIVNGLPIYHYSYIGSTATYQGVMAQDVQVLYPDAVVTGPMGYLMVDYDALGLELLRID